MKSITIVVGFAGAGKSTYIHKRTQTKPHTFIINLDPAVFVTPYESDVDIRDTVKYCELIKDGKMGPNGAIFTALNMFTTKMDQICDLLESLDDRMDVLIDTPGQIEFFTWSSVSQVIFKSLQRVSKADVKIVYLLDASKMVKFRNFSSNLLHVASIQNQFDIPVHLLYNKMDVLKTEHISKFQDVVRLFMQGNFEDAMSAFTDEYTMEHTFYTDILVCVEDILRKLTFDFITSKEIVSRPQAFAL